MCDGNGLALAHYVVALPSLHYHNELTPYPTYWAGHLTIP